MVVRTGVVEVRQGTKTRLAHAGDVIFIVSNELHGVKNTSNANVTYLVIRIADTAPPNRRAVRRSASRRLMAEWRCGMNAGRL